MTFSSFKLRSQLFELLLVDNLANFRKHFSLFLFFSVVLDVFHQHLKFGSELVAIGNQAVHLSQQRFDLLMFFERFEDHVFQFFMLFHRWIEDRLLDPNGRPYFQLQFYAVNKKGEFAGATAYESGGVSYAVCDARGPRLERCVSLWPGEPPVKRTPDTQLSRP